MPEFYNMNNVFFLEETSRWSYLIKRAKQNGICSKVTSAKVVEGWQGKAKGLLHVLWERGFIDTTNLDKYTMNGKQDACGVLMPETSLKYLMANCEDFEG